MNFDNYWAIFIKHWKLIVSCFLAVGIGTCIASKLMTPIYQSEVIIQVSVRSGTNQPDYNNLLASDQLVQTEAQLATTTSVLGAVAAHHTGLSEDQLAKEVTSVPSLNTQLFTITVQDASATRAAALANDIATTLIQQQTQAIQDANRHAQQQIQQEINTTQQQINDVTTHIAQLQASGGNTAQITPLQNRLATLQAQYNQWETALAQLELSQSQNGDLLQIAQSAQPSSTPVRPIILLNTAIGLVVGLFLGLLLALLFEQVDTRVRTAEDITRLLTWPVLGTIWQSSAADKKNIIHPQERDSNVEAYRILRTNVDFASIDKPVHTVMVTSAIPGDGKSTIAANLAIFMAKAGKSTLLIDADLHRPTQQQHFHLGADKRGLSNAILTLSMQGMTKSSGVGSAPGIFLNPQPSTNFALGAFVHAVDIPNLWVMPSGPLPPNPSELLASKAMKSLLDALEHSGIEVVIFDSPPIQYLSDASILASQVDGTLVVVDITRAHKKTLMQVKMQLGQVNAHVLGCVVNKQRRRRSDSPYDYYYYHQDDAQKEQASGQGMPLLSLPVKSPVGVRDTTGSSLTNSQQGSRLP